LAPHPDSINLNDYLFRLEEFISTRYGNLLLPSHDLNHHRRVWRNARTILEELQRKGFCFTTGFQEQLLIACMTHDTGMAIDAGERHGRESRDICRRFLTENDIPQYLHEEILFVVENHDDKSYTETSPPDSLLTILSVADDMDAFGYTGIYRYIEIYLARNNPESCLADMIVTNATRRIKHLAKVYEFLPELCEIQIKRFNILSDFLETTGREKQQTLTHIFDVIKKSLSDRHTMQETASHGSAHHHRQTAVFFRNLLTEMQE
jgi:hypothetical protein